MIPPPSPTRRWLDDQRWFAGKHQPGEVHPAASTEVGDDLVVTLVDVGADRYQLVGLMGDGAPDSLHDPATGAALARAWAAERESNGGTGHWTFHRWPPDRGWPTGPVRPLGAEQSNTSLVIDESLVVKLFRRVAPGPTPSWR